MPCDKAQPKIDQVCGKLTSAGPIKSLCSKAFSEKCPEMFKFADKGNDFICKNVVKMC